MSSSKVKVIDQISRSHCEKRSMSQLQMHVTTWRIWLFVEFFV